MEASQNKTLRTVVFILSALLLISLAVNAILWFNRTVYNPQYYVEDLDASARKTLEDELYSTTNELGKFKGLSKELDSLLSEANQKIDNQKIRISKLLHSPDKKINASLKEEVKKLKKLKDDYIDKIDALLSENKELKNYNAQLAYTVSTLSDKEQEKINTASALRAEYIEVTSFKKRSSGKYVATALAKKTNKLNVCFKVLDNKTAKPGEKKIHVRILAPNGLPLGDRREEAKSFLNKETKEEMLYTVSKKINYENKKEDVCVDYEEEERNLTAGTYMIEIYFDGVLSTTSFYILR